MFMLQFLQLRWKDPSASMTAASRNRSSSLIILIQVRLDSRDVIKLASCHFLWVKVFPYILSSFMIFL